MVDIYVKLAEDAVEKWVLEGQRRIEFSDYESLPSELTERQRGVFVSLKTTEGKLRGCIGTYHPVEENVAREIVRNSVLAASRDPRFPSLSPPDLKKITVSVDVLSEPECCKIDDLNPKQYGIVVEKGGKEGLLLPDLDGVDSIERQLEIAKRKAGITAENSDIKVQRFTVERHRGDRPVGK